VIAARPATPGFAQPEAAKPAAEKPVAEDIPELTLDNSLEKARTAASDAMAATPQKTIDPKIVEELGKATSLDDLDDEMAATLFGDENFEAIAAAAIANVPREEPAKAEDAAPAKAAPAKAAAAPASQPPAAAKPAPAPQPPAAKPAAPKPGGNAPSVTAGSGEKTMGYTGEFQMSVTSRLRMVDELTKDKKKPVYSAIKKEPAAPAKPSVGLPGAQGKADAANEAKASKAAAIDAANDDGADDKKKKKGLGGLLNRFKR
jgi:hypothetical protein